MSFPTPPSIPLTPKTFETNLDAGRLFIQMKNGHWWRLRRNGKTRKWKTEPERFLIPVKFGMKNYGQIENSHFPEGKMDSSNIRHEADIPLALRT